MTRGALRTALLLSLTACIVAKQPAAETDRQPELATVCADREGALRIESPSSSELNPDVLVSFFGPEGTYLGAARVTPGRLDCDHCPGTLQPGALVDGQSPTGRCGAAIVSTRPMRAARLTRTPAREPAAEWSPYAALDVDGDGKTDFAWLEHCDHFVLSGCGQHICDRSCYIKAPPGARRPETGELHCRSWVPDVEDCKPDN